jgi:hypothetical protein
MRAPNVATTRGLSPSVPVHLSWSAFAALPHRAAPLYGNVLRLSPMLIVSKTDVDEAIRPLDKAFSKVKK